MLGEIRFVYVLRLGFICSLLGITGQVKMGARES